MAILQAVSAADDPVDQTSYAVMLGMSGDDLDGLSAGDYFFCFSAWIATNAVQNVRTCSVAIFVNGSIVASTVRQLGIDSTIDDSGVYHLTTGTITVGEGENVDVRFITNDAANNGTWKERAIVLIPEVSGSITEAVNTGDLVEDPGTSYILMEGTDPDMTLTPASGTYLACFSTAASTTVNDTIVNYILDVGGTNQGVTEIEMKHEGSIRGANYPLWLVGSVAPNGSQAVALHYKHDKVSSTTTHERALTLVKVASGDLFEVGDTADDADSTTTEKVLEGPEAGEMAILNPGADDYMVIFASSLGYGSNTGNNAEFSIYEGGVEEAESVRAHHHEGSIDNARIPVQTNIGITTTLGSDDIKVFWKGSSTTTRTCKERNMIAFREASAAAAGPVFPNPLQRVMQLHHLGR